MRAVSDYGGLSAGPVDRSEHTLSLREKRVDAIKNLVQKRDPKFTSDTSRRSQEELPQAQYDSLAYYDRWLLGLKKNLIELGYLDEDEIARRIAEIRARGQPYR